MSDTGFATFGPQGDKPADERLHLFVGDVRDPEKPEPWQHILCCVPDRSGERLLGFAYFTVTNLKADVTCQDCLELIHA